ncbi:MAG TPA: hypothetical protein VLL54_18180 [Pyrinomonadaceae bacterium]|nr:hypothetical protein [Pyrinomonadaceae bacterium]
MIAEFQFPIFDLPATAEHVGSRQSPIGNVQRRKGAVRAQNALTAFIQKSGLLLVEFVRNTASASILS